ncbi:bifunctional hydroxymethylpyrimidine kinase/phosphomethylpyrimidine kinase [Brevibacillus fluminis]|uniref:pyridoxal kinase n=1 Tax=Brevibacillus fluminis TaxID=511487 RepID=A0A3M8DXE9_9BACL|nr:pyridoxine/pyridoxal/pyridoxamine kinase [Brevibacillus fluminis]RNB92604.1 bifunctional hydroxymethylpyrimidine kinase/phosphomethylpyrimidine kinase [Brevibacillus fluminis]
MKIYKALTIAGSDTSGGAGIQADLKTFQERKVFGMTALTVIVAQDPANGWFHNVFPIDTKLVEAQIETVVSGIGIDSFKTGMLGSSELIELVARKMEELKMPHLVIDPVMVCKGADEALHPETAISYRDVLIPKATVVTPNLFEAGQLSQKGTPKTLDEMKEAAAIIHELGAKYVLVKGGGKLQHERAVDVLYDGTTFELLESDRIEKAYTHGAGCTYSAAITAELAKGRPVRDAILTAKAFITEAIRHSFPLNQYVGPTYHAAYRDVEKA